MEFIMSIISWFQANLINISTIIAYAVAIASIIVKLTPTLKDDDWLKGFVKFIGKYIALDKYGPSGKE